MEKGEKTGKCILTDYIPSSQWDIPEVDKRSMFYNPVTDERMRISLPSREVMEKRWAEL